MPGEKIGGTIQNDLLKEYVARGTYIYPPRPSMRIITDIFAYCARQRARSGTRSRSPATTSARRARRRCRRSRSRWPTASRTCEAAIDAGLDVDEFAPRLSFFWNAPQQLLRRGREVPGGAPHVVPDHERAVRREERALEAAALPHADRRVDAHRAAAREQHRARDACRRWPRCSAARRACTPTGSTRPSACRPSGRRRSRCAPSRSSASSPAWPTRVDPLAGSYFVESLTDEVEAGGLRRTSQRIDDIGRRGGRHRGRLHAGRDRAGRLQFAKAVDDGEKVIVGVNQFTDDRRRGRRGVPDRRRRSSSSRSIGPGRSGRQARPGGRRPGVGRRRRDGDGARATCWCP